MAELIHSRRNVLNQNLNKFKSQLAAVSEKYKRDISDITLIAVTKGFPVSDVLYLHELGILDFGESKHQEIVSKLPEFSELECNLHFIGQLQRNKVKHVASYSSYIHSIDRPELINALSTASLEKKAPPIFLQVDLAEHFQTGRGGASPDSLNQLGSQADVAGLSVLGLMAVAPLGESADLAFEQFVQISTEFQIAFPAATARSIGMSGDWELGVKHGATHLRIGAALLGNRD